MILETERLILAPLTVADAPFVYPFLSDPEVMAHWDQAPIDDPEEVEACVVAQVAQMEQAQAHYWAVRQSKTGDFLGCCELIDIDQRHSRAELRVIVARAGWGQGYGLEALRALLTHAASIGLKRLIARSHVGDARAERLLERLGFEAEGYLKGHVQRDGERRDCRLYGLLL
ncbi:MAG: GNAT family N-acetyltransferase [Alphaproteobacteria bacterium]|nr:GNAT family N-acetyltransferase [Alphaproteobacteria bacterium]